MAASYEGKLLSSSSEGSASFFGNENYKEKNDSFIRSGNLVAATVYQAPAERYKDSLSKVTYGSMNIEKYSEESNNSANKAAAEAMGYRSPLSEKQALHYKSYTKKEGEDYTSWVPTGNAGESSVRPDSSILEFFGMSKKQTNVGLLFTGKLAERQLELQKSIYEGRPLESADLGDGYSMSRGDVSSQRMLSALDQVEAGDTVRISSPYMNESSMVKSLKDAQDRGADVRIISSAGHTNTPERRLQNKILANEGLNVYENDNTLVHEKSFSIKGRRINVAAVGSDNMSNRTRANKSIDYMTFKYGESALLDNLLNESDQRIKSLNKLDSPKPNSYQDGEFGFLYKTQYRTYAGTKNEATLVGEAGGFIKSTKLNADYFDRHIIKRQPKYRGFSQAYEAISGTAAPEAVSDMDEALSNPSAGHQLNRILKMRLYVEGMGILGSAVVGAGRFLDFATGHYAFKADKTVKKGDTRGSGTKFTAQLAKQREDEAYKGGPIEKSFAALYGAAQGFAISGIGFGAALAFQYGINSFLESGARQLTEGGKTLTLPQYIMAGQYLSKRGIEVSREVQTAVAASHGGIPVATAHRHVMERLGYSAESLINNEFSVVGGVNTLRKAGASFMGYVLPGILKVVVPKDNLQDALLAGEQLVKTIGTQVGMREGKLTNLKAEHSKAMGNAIDKLGRFIPLKLHYWIPQLRDQAGVTSIDGGNLLGPKVAGQSNARQQAINANNPSLAKMFGENFLNQTIGAFIQTTDTLGNILTNPKKHLDFISRLHASSGAIERQERSVVSALNAGTLSAAQLENFLASQAVLSKNIAKYSPNAPALTQSLGQGIKNNKSLGRLAFGIVGALTADYMLDQFVMRTQGANLIDQIKLTRAVRTSGGNILQVEFNSTMPVYGTLAVAAASAMTAGFALPAVYGVNKTTNAFYKSIADQASFKSAAAPIQEILNRIGSETAGSVRSRFNFKAAFIGSVLGLVAAKAAFYAGSVIANLMFPAKGVKIDAAVEPAVSRILDALNVTKKHLYKNPEGSKYASVRDSADVRSAVTREFLKRTVDDLNDSEQRLDKKRIGSSFYSVALQLTNNSFVQTAILERTDASKGITSYSFGVQLLPAAGVGITPMLPIGITNRVIKDVESARTTTLGLKSSGDRYGLNVEDSSTINSLANLFFKPFDFLAYSPNSQIVNTAMSLGTIGFVMGGVNKLLDKYEERGKSNRVVQDLLIVGKGVRLAGSITTSVLKGTLALTDLLPRMVANTFKTVFANQINEPTGFSRMFGSLLKSRFGQGVGLFAIASALTDPILGVDPADQEGRSSSGVKLFHQAMDGNSAVRSQAPFANPVNRLVTAGMFTAYALTAMNHVGIGSAPKVDSIVTKLIPYGKQSQMTLFNPASSNLQRSGARMALIAGIAFTTQLASSILARGIGQVFGEKGLTETYKKVGLLRIFSGISASDYSEEKGRNSNLLMDVAGDLINRIPFIGESITKITGLYKDDPNLFLPVPGAPTGFTYRADGSVRQYVQNQSGTTDASISSYTKYLQSINADTRGLLEGIEGADLSKVSNSDELMKAVIRGGDVKARISKSTRVSEYSMQAVSASGSQLLQMAIHRKMGHDLNLLTQRGSELLKDEQIRQIQFGNVILWNGGQKVKFNKPAFDFNEGVDMHWQHLVKRGIVKEGDYKSFETMMSDQNISQRNVFAPTMFQSIADLSATYFKGGDKGSSPLISSAILSGVALGVGGLSLMNVGLSMFHLAGAVEIVKQGKSVRDLEAEVYSLSKSFKSKTGISVSHLDAQNQPMVDQATGKARHLIQPSNPTSTLAVSHSIDFDEYGTTASEYKASHKKMISNMQRRLQEFAHGQNMPNSTKNVFDQLLKGGAEQEYALTHIKNTFATETRVELRQAHGSSTMYDITVGRNLPNPTTTITSFAQDLISGGQHDQLAVYANQLAKDPNLSDRKKREMLNIARIKIESGLLQENVFQLHTNFHDPSALTESTAVKAGGGLFSKAGKLASSAGAVGGIYLAFGKDAYSAIEGSVYLFGGDRQRRRRAADSLYSTSVGLTAGLITQKAVATAMGKKTFSIPVLIVSAIATASLAYGMGEFKHTNFGRGISRAERYVKDFATTGLTILGDFASKFTKFIFDPLTDGVFTPIGKSIQAKYNSESRKGMVQAMLAEMFLPNSIFKTNNHIDKKTAYGQLPYEFGDGKQTYQNKNTSGLMSTMKILNPEYGIHPFLMGKASSYSEKAFYNKYFSSDRQEPGALSNFGMTSSYNVSNLTMMLLRQKSIYSGYERYGRAFRRAKQEQHDYIGQALSGLGTFNELSRIVYTTGTEASRLIADEFERVKTFALNPIGKALSDGADGALNKINKIVPGIRNTLRWMSQPVVWATAAPYRLAANLSSGTLSFGKGFILNAMEGVVKNLNNVRSGFDDVLLGFSRRLEGASKPVATIVLGALHGVAKASSFGAASAVKVIQLHKSFRFDTTGLDAAEKLASTPPTPKEMQAMIQEQDRQTATGIRTVNFIKGAAGKIASGTMHFFKNTMPVILDSTQIIPSTGSLVGYSDPYMTKSQTVRLYEQQLSGVGSVLAGIAASAARLSLIPTMLITMGAAYLGGKGGRFLGGRDYDENSKYWAEKQALIGYASLGLSAIQTAYRAFTKIKLYKNYVQVTLNADGKKQVGVVYDNEYTKDVEKQTNLRQHLDAQPSSNYKNARIARSNKALALLEMESLHEGAHLRQFDMESDTFKTSKVSNFYSGPDSSVMHTYRDALDSLGIKENTREARRFKQTVENISRVSAQNQIADFADNISKREYAKIYQLEKQANYTQLTEMGDWAKKRGMSTNQITKHLYRLEKQLTKGRFMGRRATGLSTDLSSIERLYSPGSSGSAPAGGITSNTASHLPIMSSNRYATLASSGFHSSSRLMLGLARAMALPGALYESFNIRTELNRVQGDFKQMTERQAISALKNRGAENHKYVTAQSSGFLLGSVTRSPLGSVLVAAYTMLAQSGAKIPFTNISMLPELGREDYSNEYAHDKYLKLMRGEYIYDEGMTSSMPLTGVRSHFIDEGYKDILGQKIRGVFGAITSNFKRKDPRIAEVRRQFKADWKMQQRAEKRAQGKVPWGMRTDNFKTRIINFFTKSIDGVVMDSANSQQYRETQQLKGAMNTATSKLVDTAEVKRIYGSFKMFSNNWNTLDLSGMEYGGRPMFLSQYMQNSTLIKGAEGTWRRRLSKAILYASGLDKRFMGYLQIAKFNLADDIAHLREYNRALDTSLHTGLPTKFNNEMLPDLSRDLDLNPYTAKEAEAVAKYKTKLAWVSTPYRTVYLGTKSIYRSAYISIQNVYDTVSDKLISPQSRFLDWADNSKIKVKDSLTANIVKSSSAFNKVLASKTFGNIVRPAFAAHSAVSSAFNRMGVAVSDITQSLINRSEKRGLIPSADVRYVFGSWAKAKLGDMFAPIGNGFINLFRGSGTGVLEAIETTSFANTKLPKGKSTFMANMPSLKQGVAYSAEPPEEFRQMFERQAAQTAQAANKKLSVWTRIKNSYLKAELNALRLSAKFSKSPVSAWMTNRLLQKGLLDTTLTGFAVYADTTEILGSSAKILGFNKKTTKFQYQEAYVGSARGRSGLVTTFGLMPAFGFLKGGLLLGIPLAAFQEHTANKKAEERYNSRRASGKEPNWIDNTFDALREVIKPAIEQTILSSYLGKFANTYREAKYTNSLVNVLQASKTNPKLEMYLLNRSANAVKPGFIRQQLIVAQAVKARGVTAFGANQAGKAISQFGSAAKSFGGSAVKLLSKSLDWVQIPIIAYDSYQVSQSKTSDQDRETWANLGGSSLGYALGWVGAIIGGAIGGTGGFAAGLFGGPAAVVTAPTGAAVGGTGGAVAGKISGTMIGEVIGRNIGAFAADVKNFSVGKATENIGRDVGNTFNSTMSFFGWAGNAVAAPFKFGWNWSGDRFKDIGNWLTPKANAAEITNSSDIKAFKAKVDALQNIEKERAEFDSTPKTKEKSWLDKGMDLLSSVLRGGSRLTKSLVDGGMNTVAYLRKLGSTVKNGVHRNILKFGRFLSNYVTGSPAQAAESSTASGGNIGGGAFSGPVAGVNELAAMTAMMPESQRATNKAALYGNAFAGRAPASIELLNNSNVSSMAKGKTIAFDSSLMAAADLAAIRETDHTTSDKSYSSQTRGNKNYGRYQIMYGTGDTTELSSVIKGGIQGKDKAAQDRAFAGRLFYGPLNRGGNEYIQFVQGGYKYDDFVKLRTKMANEWQSLRGNAYYKDTKKVDNELKKYYGSEEVANRFLYGYYMNRKAMYDTQAAGKYTPAQADKIMNGSKVTPKPAAPATKKVTPVNARVNIGKKTKVTSVASASGVQPQNRPKQEEIAFKLENGVLKASVIASEDESTFNSRANTPSEYRLMGGRRAQMA